MLHLDAWIDLQDRTNAVCEYDLLKIAKISRHKIIVKRFEILASR